MASSFLPPGPCHFFCPDSAISLLPCPAALILPCSPAILKLPSCPSLCYTVLRLLCCSAAAHCPAAILLPLYSFPAAALLSLPCCHCPVVTALLSLPCCHCPVVPPLPCCPTTALLSLLCCPATALQLYTDTQTLLGREAGQYTTLDTFVYCAV